MKELIKVIVSGDEKVLLDLREGLADLMQQHGLEVVEKGAPKAGRNPAYTVMYLTGEKTPPAAGLDLEYVAFEGGA